MAAPNPTTEATVAETTPLLSSNPSDPATPAAPGEPGDAAPSAFARSPAASGPAFLLAPCTYTDTPQMASIAASAYLPSGFVQYLNPNAYTYLIDYIRGFHLRVRARMLSSHGHAYKAYLASNPATVLGYVQYTSPHPRSLEPFWRRWWFKARLVWDSWGFKDRSMDSRAVGFLMRYVNPCKKFIKEGEEYYVQSLAVSPRMQRKGVGKALMIPLLEEAEREGRRVWLEASPHGEALYRSLGFILKEKFEMQMEIEETGGGVMVWEPSWLRDGIREGEEV